MWIAAIAAALAVVAVGVSFWPRAHQATGATAAPTAASTPTTSPLPIQSATPPPSAAASNQSSSTNPTASAVAVLDTSTWPKPVDCSKRTPPPEHIAYCKVPGRSQVQVLEACKAAALGTLWENSHNPKLGVKNPRLADDVEVCVRGSGLEKNSASSNVLGYLRKGRLQYIFVAGVNVNLNEASRQVFNATGDGSDIGFIAFNETELLETIISFYGELT